MAETKGFLERWSTRKRAARDAAALPETGPESGPERGPETGPATEPYEAAAPEPEPDIDPATLPPIDSIETGADLQAFLRKGVPRAVKQAALRRFWSADATIREFREVADYDWDFNAPGYGALLPQDDPKAAADALTALMRRRVATTAAPTDAPPVPPAVAEPAVAEPEVARSGLVDAADDPANFDPGSPEHRESSEAPAVAAGPSAEETPRRRRHGAATPSCSPDAADRRRSTGL